MGIPLHTGKLRNFWKPHGAGSKVNLFKKVDAHAWKNHIHTKSHALKSSMQHLSQYSGGK